jgi:hypothetical protein
MVGILVEIFFKLREAGAGATAGTNQNNFEQYVLVGKKVPRDNSN